jgi:hypothetical protein
MTAICPPCARAADTYAAMKLDFPGLVTDPNEHDPIICRDYKIQPSGCPCQHGQTTTEKR